MNYFDKTINDFVRENLRGHLELKHVPYVYGPNYSCSQCQKRLFSLKKLREHYPNCTNNTQNIPKSKEGSTENFIDTLDFRSQLSANNQNLFPEIISRPPQINPVIKSEIYDANFKTESQEYETIEVLESNYGNGQNTSMLVDGNAKQCKKPPKQLGRYLGR